LLKPISRNASGCFETPFWVMPRCSGKSETHWKETQIATLPLEFFHDVLDEHFSQNDVQRQIDTALN
jgi:hypothetical protein